MKEKTAEAVKPLPFNLASLLGQLGNAEVKHVPKERNEKGLPVIGVVNNMVTRRLFSLSGELGLSYEAILGGPAENVDQLLDAMPGPARREAKAQLTKLTGQIEPINQLFWALVKEEIPCSTEDSSGIALYENWQIALLPPQEKSFAGMCAIPLPSEIIEVIRRVQAARH